MKPDQLMDSLKASFERVFCPGLEPRPFGSGVSAHQGVSDGCDGVQWNAGIDRKNGVVTVGVNLEGLKYVDWPIARFIEAERQDPVLPRFARSYEHAAIAELWFSRDAWQVSSRPAILEQHFGPMTPVLLDGLSDALWQSMLAEAYDCLDRNRNHRARAVQLVTLKNGPAEKEVSPHLQIKMVVPRRSLQSTGLDGAFEEARVRLLPVRELVQRQVVAVKS